MVCKQPIRLAPSGTSPKSGLDQLQPDHVDRASFRRFRDLFGQGDSAFVQRRPLVLIVRSQRIATHGREDLGPLRLELEDLRR